MTSWTFIFGIKLKISASDTRNRILFKRKQEKRLTGEKTCKSRVWMKTAESHLWSILQSFQHHLSNLVFQVLRATGGELLWSDSSVSYFRDLYLRCCQDISIWTSSSSGKEIHFWKRLVVKRQETPTQTALNLRWQGWFIIKRSTTTARVQWRCVISSRGSSGRRTRNSSELSGDSRAFLSRHAHLQLTTMVNQNEQLAYKAGATRTCSLRMQKVNKMITRLTAVVS